MKDRVLLEITNNPGLDAEEIAEKLNISVKESVELIGELIDEGRIEYNL